MRLGLVVLVLLLLAPGAVAHAVYLDSTPAKGARLDQAPDQVKVRLTEPIDPANAELDVLDAAGTRVSFGAPIVVAGPQATLTVAVKNDLGDGAYLVRWKVLSTADGHATTGSIGFAVGDQAAIPAAQGSEATQSSALSPWARALTFAGLSMAAGALLFLAIGRSWPWTQPGLARSMVIGTATNAVGVALLFYDTMRQSGLTAGQVASTQVGNVLCVRLAASVAALAAAFLVHRRGPSPARGALVAGLLVVVAAASARLGHASLAGASAILVDLLHLATVALWVGGLGTYLFLLHRAAKQGIDKEDHRALGLKFSPYALACVAILVATGLATTWTITKDYWIGLDLLSSAWGTYLALKIILLAGMLLLAGANRYVLLGNVKEWPAALRKAVGWRVGDLGPNGIGLRRLVQVEAILGIATLFLAALLTSISPPSALAAVAPTASETEPIEVHGETYGLVGTWDVQPRSGASSTLNMLILDHMHGDVQTNDTCGRDSCIQLQVTPPDGQGAQVYQVDPTTDGRWDSEPILWVGAGTYSVVLRIQTAQVYLDELPFDVVVA